jgi:hypothetical protein
VRYLNAKHPAVCWPLLPWFVEGDQTRKQIFLELYARLEQEPENTFVEIALEGEYCKAILIAYVSGDCVWVWQARASNDFNEGKKMLNNLINWSKNKKINKLKAACSKDKNAKLIMRRFGFKKNNEELIKVIA